MNFQEFKEKASIGEAGSFLYQSSTKESDWHQHPNGRGWVENTAHVDPTAYVGEYGVVADKAKVLANASINSRKGMGFTIVQGNAIITDNAQVTEGAKISDNATISGSARVCEAYVQKNAHITENAEVSGISTISDYALVAGNAQVSSGAVRETARVDGDAKVMYETIGGNRHVTDHEVVGGDPNSIRGCEAAVSFNLPSPKTLLAQHGIDHDAIGGATDAEKALSSTDVYKVAMAAKGSKGLS